MLLAGRMVWVQFVRKVRTWQGKMVLTLRDQPRKFVGS